MKLVTAASVLDALGPDTRLRTRVAVIDPEATTPRVVIIGAGDPSLRSTGAKVGGAGTSLTPASLQELAASTARALALRGITAVKVRLRRLAVHRSGRAPQLGEVVPGGRHRRARERAGGGSGPPDAEGCQPRR